MTQHITIVGVGLIGGSFALALREAGHNAHFVGVGRNQQSLERAIDRGIVDSSQRSVADAVAETELVLLATPVGAVDAVLQQMAASLRPETIVTDAGSVKQSVIESARARLPYFENFVPAHPIAGTEHSGVEAGFASLYRGKRLILTPVAETSVTATDTVAQLWQAAGAVVEHMDPAYHDAVFAATSHLPHMLAFSLVETLSRMDKQTPILRHTGGGFADYTRIASSDPVMWRDICLLNREALLSTLENFRGGLDTLVAAIDEKDGDTLEQLFITAKQTRDTKVLPVAKDRSE